MVENANTAIFSMYPDINVGNHLAQRFIPGYGDNNSLLAQSDGYPGVPGNESWKDEGEIDDESEEESNKIIEFIRTKIFGFPEKFIEESGAVIEIGNPEEEVEDKSSGYNYLKDTIRLDRIWSRSLNIVYVLYVLIFIIVGFMIMFRKKLQGNVTVTFSRALPNLIISLILATFSFALVGFMMDVEQNYYECLKGNILRDIYRDKCRPLKQSRL